MKLRELEPADYDRGFLRLLGQLTTVGEISRQQFEDLLYILSTKKPDSCIAVIEDEAASQIVATASLTIEHKFIHGCSKVGHIEDVVVNEAVRGQRLGQRIIQHLLSHSQQQGCYKVILDCAEANVPFYEKCGFRKKEVQMVQGPETWWHNLGSCSSTCTGPCTGKRTESVSGCPDPEKMGRMARKQASPVDSEEDLEEVPIVAHRTSSRRTGRVGVDWSKLGTDSLHKYKNAKMANLPPTISSKEDLISHVSKHFSQQVVDERDTLIAFAVSLRRHHMQSGRGSPNGLKKPRQIGLKANGK